MDGAGAAPPRQARRIRPWLLALLAIFYILAWGMPLLIPDGLDDWGEEHLGAAAAGLREARYCFWDNPLEHLWVRRFVVAGVTEGDAPVAPGEILSPGWEVRVKVHTLFGLPYAAARFDSRGGSVEYRLPTGPLSLLCVLALPIGVIWLWWRVR